MYSVTFGALVRAGACAGACAGAFRLSSCDDQLPGTRVLDVQLCLLLSQVLRRGNCRTRPAMPSCGSGSSQSAAWRPSCDDQLPGTRVLDVQLCLLLLEDQVPCNVLHGGLPAMISFQVLEVQLCLLLGQVL